MKVRADAPTYRREPHRRSNRNTGNHNGPPSPPHPESNEAPHLRHVVLLRAQVLLLLLLHEELLLLAPPGRAQLLEAGLHLLQHLGGVAHHQLHAVLGRLQELHRLLVVFSFYALWEDGGGAMKDGSCTKRLDSLGLRTTPLTDRS